MLTRLLLHAVARMERAYDDDSSYLRDLACVDPAAFRKFALTMLIAGHRGGLPVRPWYAAKLVTARSEDCGPCTQLVVNMALKDGVPAPVIEAILKDDENGMGAEAHVGWLFARGVTERRADLLEAATARAETRWGARGRTGLALTVTATRLFPTLKAGLGFAKSCQRVSVAGRVVVPVRDGA